MSITTQLKEIQTKLFTMKLNELKAFVRNILQLTDDYTRCFGKLTTKSTWIAAIQKAYTHGMRQAV